MDFKLKSHISAAIFSLFIRISTGTIVYQRIENWDWIQAFYFSVTTLTTVGLGDLAPTTNLSRLFTSFYVLFGVAVVLTSVGLIGSRLIARTEKGVHIGIRKEIKTSPN